MKFWQIIKDGDAAGVSRMIAADADLVREADRDGKTGLHWAAEFDRVDVAHVLIDAGAEIEARTSWGASPLDWAATMGSARVADLLLSRGAGGLTLISCAALGKLAKVKAMVESGEDLTAHRRRDAPTTPNADWPADSAHILEDILSDALYAAARNGHTGVVSYLLSCGASVNAKGFFGASAIHWAAINGWSETVDLLMSSGADINLKDNRFQAYPDGWAEEGGHTRIANRLRRRG